MARDAWAMVTMKLPDANDIPDWFACNYVPKNNGEAMVSASVNTGTLVEIVCFEVSLLKIKAKGRTNWPLEFLKL